MIILGTIRYEHNTKAEILILLICTRLPLYCFYQLYRLIQRLYISTMF
jgi:hypothetical protein